MGIHEQVQRQGREDPTLVDTEKICSIARLPRGTPTDGMLSFTHVPSPTIAQRLSLMALAGNAFTILRAGLAFTTQILPKISFLPALVAGFVLVLSLQRPGKLNTPVLPM